MHACERRRAHRLAPLHLTRAAAAPRRAGYREEIASLQTALQTSAWIQEGSVDSWYAAFGHTDAAESEAEFMSALRAWLATPAGMAYSKDVVLSDDAARPISMSRIGATYDPESVATSEQMVAGMRGLREEVAAAAAGAFPFTYQVRFQTLSRFALLGSCS